MFIQGFHLVLLVFIFCCIHMFIMVLYDITFKLDEVMMLHVSSLYLYGLFHPILTPVFYKIIGFILFFISHHFLLDTSMYELYTFLFILPIHDHQIVIVILSFFVIQVIHYISLVKKALWVDIQEPFMYNKHAVESSVCSPDDSFIGKKSRKN